MSIPIKSHAQKLERLAPAKPYLPFLLMCGAIFITIIASTVVSHGILDAEEKAIGDAIAMTEKIAELKTEKLSLEREVSALEREKKTFERTLETKLQTQKQQVFKDAQTAIDEQLMTWTKESKEREEALKQQVRENIKGMQSINDEYELIKAEVASNTKLYEGKIEELTRENNAFRQRLNEPVSSTTQTAPNSQAPARKSIDPINDPINIIKGIFSSE